MTDKDAVSRGGVFTALLLCGLMLASAQEQSPRPPNIVVIFADDLGYGDLGAFGAPSIRTPALDRMAAEGQKWTHFYVQPVCSPSRAALLTGRLPVRNGMFGTPTGTSPKVFRDNAAEGLPIAEVTIAELLKSAGYRTGMVGKWHLGQLPQFLPMRQGFDSWFGLPYSHDMRMAVPRDNGYRTGAYYSPKPEYWDVPLMRSDQVVERPADHRTLTARYTEEAVRFIGENRSRPFFLYLAHSMPHIPLARSDEFAGHSAGGIYGDVIEEIDWSVGAVLDALRSAAIDRNTLVLFTSDNGPWLPFRDHAGSAGPLRQGKGTTWEGGVRAPAIFWWPGTIRPGVVTGIGSALDILATAASLSGARVPADRPIDSVDLSAALKGTAPSARHELFYYWDSELRAVRKGNYKAHFVTSGAYDDPEPRAAHDPPLLFDLAADPGERYNIAAAHPDVVADLVKTANAHRAAVVVDRPLFDRLLPVPQKVARFGTEQAATPSSWATRDEREAFLSTASVVSDAPTDGRLSWRATLDDGTRRHDASLVTEDGSGPTGRNYKSNVAAYELDKLLGLNLVVPSVERRVNGRPASIIWWVDSFAMNELDRRRRGIEPPDPDRWGRQMQAVRVFDELISNTYRDTAPPLYLNTVWDNLLITTDWTIWLTDHTGAFRTRRYLLDPDSLVRCPRLVFDKLRTLNHELLHRALGKYLSSKQLDALEVRRRLLVKHFDRRIKRIGKADVLYDLPPRSGQLE